MSAVAAIDEMELSAEQYPWSSMGSMDKILVDQEDIHQTNC
jgi:hypothetical protein